MKLTKDEFSELSGYLTARQYVVYSMVCGLYERQHGAMTLTKAAKLLVLDRGQVARLYKAALKTLRVGRRSSRGPLRPPAVTIYPEHLLECLDNPWLMSLLDRGIRRSELDCLLAKLPHQLGQYAVFRLTATSRQMWLKCAWSRKAGIAKAALTHLQAAKYPRFIKPEPWKIATPPKWDRKKRASFCSIKRAAGIEWTPVLRGLGCVRAIRALDEFNTLRLRLELIAMKRGVAGRVVRITRSIDSFSVEMDQGEPMLVLLQEV